MTTTILDTRPMRAKLIDAGFQEEMADAMLDVIVDSTDVLVTKEHLKSELRLQTIHMTAINLTIGGLVIALLQYLG
jgi:hypothetical protein